MLPSDMFVDVKYINLLSSQLPNFKRKSNELYNFSCPLCGDSKKNKYKARGYIYRKQGKWSYKCHNCNRSMTFDKFLWTIDSGLSKSYRMERFQFGHTGNTEISLPLRIEKNNYTLDSLCLKASMSVEALKYLRSRKIPENKYEQIYFTNDLNILKKIFKNRYEHINFKEEPRLLFPIHTLNNSLLGVVSRSILPNTKLRYINLTLDSDEPLIYNLNKVDMSKRKFVVEGAIDSLFLDNSIAVDGVSFNKASQFIDKNRDILVYDNDPRNIDICNVMRNMSNLGYNIFVWPENFKSKDINQMVLDGYSNIESFIENRTFKGLRFNLEFAKWKKN